jgi:hypothetical protein
MDAAEARHRDEIAKKCTNLKNELLVVLLFAKLIVIETSSRQRARQLIIQQMFDHAHHLKIIGRAANKHLGGDRDRPVRAVKCSACGCFTTCPLAGSSNPDCNVDACPCLVLDTATRALAGATHLKHTPTNGLLGMSHCTTKCSCKLGANGVWNARERKHHQRHGSKK